jgi:hypothetical protein
MISVEEKKHRQKTIKRFLKEVGLFHEFCNCIKKKRGTISPKPFETINYDGYQSYIIMCSFGWSISRFRGWCDIYQYLSRYGVDYNGLMEDGVITGVKNIINRRCKK